MSRPPEQTADAFQRDLEDLSRIIKRIDASRISIGRKKVILRHLRLAQLDLIEEALRGDAKI